MPGLHIYVSLDLQPRPPDEVEWLRYSTYGPVLIATTP